MGGSFDKDGFGSAQAEISSFAKKQLGIEAPLRLPTSRPTLEQLKACFPRNATVPEAALWRIFEAPAPRELSSASASSSAAAPQAAQGFAVPLARTRLQHRVALAAAAAASAKAEAKASAGVAPRGISLPGNAVRRRVLPASFQRGA